MSPEEQLQMVVGLREQTLRGSLVHLVPMRLEHAGAVLRLRNSDRAIFNLAQSGPLTSEMHQTWYRSYLERNDDIAWMIKLPTGSIIGTVSLYSIGPAGGSGEKGRLVIDEDVAMTAPYAVETDLLVLDLAFNKFDLARVFASIRPENGKVISMHRRIGFRFTRGFVLRTIPYHLYTLERADFNRALLERIVQHWRKRLECAAG
jgi:RimJ/RimL family protein N-acetyltransferase